MNMIKSIFSLFLVILFAPFYHLGEMIYESKLNKRLVEQAASKRGFCVTIMNASLLICQLLYPAMTGIPMSRAGAAISLTLAQLVVYQLLAIVIASFRKQNDELGYSWYTCKLPNREFFILEQWIVVIGTIFMWALMFGASIFLVIFFSL